METARDRGHLGWPTEHPVLYVGYVEKAVLVVSRVRSYVPLLSFVSFVTQVQSLVLLWETLSPGARPLTLKCRRGLTPIQHCIEGGNESALREVLRTAHGRSSLQAGGKEVSTMLALGVGWIDTIFYS